ncbi:MAG: NAD-dependent succinate-semialdehyde dehydrogenase [Pseudomonadota bacterium]
MRDMQDSSLMETRARIGDAWVEGAARRTFAVRNPATGEEIAAVADLSRDDAAAAVEAAAAAQPAWAAMLASERAAILKRWNDLIVENADDLGALITLEMGKPLAEAKGEVIYGASFIEWFAEEGKRIYGDTIPAHKPNTRLIVQKQPVGVVGAITPWNFPVAMITRKVAPAIAVGCTVIIKPAEQTPLSALALAVLGERAGMPPGVLNIVTAEDGVEIGKLLCESPLVRKMTFTGSTEVGRILMRQCADDIKKVSLELGGNAPFIVFDDADLDAATEGAMISKFRNAGQTCVCANRIYVQAGVYDAFAEKLVEAVGKLRVGDGFGEGVTTGPLIDDAGLAKVESHVSDAVSNGAEVKLGGNRHSLGGTFFEPTVLTGVTPAMKVSREETFGPVAALFRFETEEEAIQLANDTEYGLAAYFYSRDIGRVMRVADALDYGIIGANDALPSTAVAPFGGMKQSGLGREGSKYGVEDFLEIKYVCLGGV